ncbi:I78 family peptidase inhibitor [Histidinibacterium aquaticum]|nr:I78 family peptidase inhibitor [Histidinibacterium aquaticum]
MIRIASLPAAALATLAACDTAPGTPVETAPQEDTCNADQLSDDIGRNVGELEITATGPVRTLGPNDARTMDFVPERLNLEVDAEGNLVRAFCG